MTQLNFILASLRHHRRIHLAVALAVAVATAVLAGALVLGDSVRGSLRDLVIERLGRIQVVITAGQPFREQLAEELAASPAFADHFESAHPALLLTGTLIQGSGSTSTRATGVSCVGYDPAFWELGAKSLPAPPDSGVALTQPLADELNVAVGQDVLLMVSVLSPLASDSLLGEKSDFIRSRRLKVTAILPAEGLARFALQPSQHAPRNAFVPLEVLQDLVEQPGRVNAILVASRQDHAAPDEADNQALADAIRPKLADYGIHVEGERRNVEGRSSGNSAFHIPPSPFVQVSSDALTLPDYFVETAEATFPEVTWQPVVTYLANTIVVGEKKVPYSTIVGVNSTPEIGPLLDNDGKPIHLADDEIALNRWADDELGAKVGDDVAITYYEPESTHGDLHEHEPVHFYLAAIVELKTVDGQPTAAADPHLVPRLKGVTDQKSISDWELPFELVERIRPQDEDYWDEYSTTPKAFVSLATAKRLWQSRWGSVSLLRAPAGVNLSSVEVASRLEERLDPTKMGLAFLPVKQLGLAASAGTTPFEALFLGFSFFLIAAAVMLIAILSQLGVDQRAAEVGVLASTGLRRKQIARLFGREGMVVVACGVVVGTVLGIGYAWLMLLALKTVWVEAIGTPFLRLHVAPRSLVIALLTGIIVSWLTVRWSLRQLFKVSARRLLAGNVLPPLSRTEIASQRPSWVSGILFIIAAVCAAFGMTLTGEVQAGAFFGSGAAVLVGLLIEIRRRLQNGSLVRSGSFTLGGLAMRNAARNPGRSTLTIGLVAAASFLILAVSAFRLAPTSAGTGAFSLLATSDQPIHYDLNSPEGRVDLGVSDEESRLLDGWQFFAFRVRAGEDASCLNLYQPTQPRVLGVPSSLGDAANFAWAATEGGDNPWQLLQQRNRYDADGRPIIPVILDYSTAIYGLHLSGVGSRFTIRDGNEQPVALEVAGLLKNSVLQGDLLISEASFLRLYPETGGYRFFLMKPTCGWGQAEGEPPVSQPSVGGLRSTTAIPSAREMATTLESTLADYGFDAIDTRQRLEGFLAVQNTYLSTFQSLGALGLLLGTVGLAMVELRSVLERRGELAVMRAGGFRPSRLVQLVLGENAVLLLTGLAVGGLAAAVALVPHWAFRAAGIPWVALAGLLAATVVICMSTAWFATRSVLNAPIVPALRGD